MVREGQASSAISILRGVIQNADTLGMKYLSVESSLYLAEGLLQTHAYAQANAVLEQTLTQSENMGLRGFLARGHFLMATALRLNGRLDDSRRELNQAQQIVEDIRKEAGESVMKRSDFAAITRKST